MADQPGFFDLDARYRALSAAGDPLERLAAVAEVELFRAEREAALDRSDRAKGGRPPYDAVPMVKALVLQTLYTRSPTGRPSTSSRIGCRSCGSSGSTCTGRSRTRPRSGYSASG